VFLNVNLVSFFQNFLDILFESILNQSYTRYKLLIIDDGSNSSTVEVLQRLTSNPQLTEKTFVVRLVVGARIEISTRKFLNS
jgi:hypothetical protein